jgi:hypothetical protein
LYYQGLFEPPKHQDKWNRKGAKAQRELDGKTDRLFHLSVFAPLRLCGSKRLFLVS